MAIRSVPVPGSIPLGTWLPGGRPRPTPGNISLKSGCLTRTPARARWTFFPRRAPPSRGCAHPACSSETVTEPPKKPAPRLHQPAYAVVRPIAQHHRPPSRDCQLIAAYPIDWGVRFFCLFLRFPVTTTAFGALLAQLHHLVASLRPQRQVSVTVLAL